MTFFRGCFSGNTSSSGACGANPGFNRISSLGNVSARQSSSTMSNRAPDMFTTASLPPIARYLAVVPLTRLDLLLCTILLEYYPNWTPRAWSLIDRHSTRTRRCCKLVIYVCVKKKKKKKNYLFLLIALCALLQEEKHQQKKEKKHVTILLVLQIILG